MEAEITAHANGAAWQLLPQSGVAGIALAVLFLYLFFRHLMFVLMVVDILLGFLRRFSWFPKEGSRLKAFGHWVTALVLFAGYLVAAMQFGWIEFVPV
ncbi:hypothetical protein [Leisingera sp. ANG-M7]|uniref:hypothetical protein n=1 Tax=Leisingera sp. ANG-M7 TaxID=1577902 RepID=UPI0005804F06|nr:hypothetical protein [Leisingera sp. ANG-M7]KIC35839.1 hypothetical protein RA26_16255 [Leisingera sp. ANG-M7]